MFNADPLANFIRMAPPVVLEALVQEEICVFVRRLNVNGIKAELEKTAGSVEGSMWAVEG